MTDETSGGPGTRETDGSGAGDAEFPRPPVELTDDEGRSIVVREFDDDTGALIEMYDQFAMGDRTQAVPPRRKPKRDSWAEMLVEKGVNLVAWNGDEAVGHAVLVPREGTEYELAVFVRSDHQQAHVGTELVRCLLGRGRDEGVESVWLSVEYHNDPAIALFRSVGFEKVGGDVDYVMERDLSASGSHTPV